MTAIFNSLAHASMSRYMNKFEHIAANVANTDVAGFRGQLYTIVGVPVNVHAQHPPTSYNASEQVHRDFRPGPYTFSGHPLHAAIQDDGTGFFKVNNPTTQSTHYTRNGRFTLDIQGYVVTSNGDRVQGSNGDILIPPGARDITMGNDGTLSFILTNGEKGSAGTILVEKFSATDLQKLVSQGNAQFHAPDDVVPEKVNNPHILGNGYEGANVQAVTMMVDMMQTLRQIEILSTRNDEYNSLIATKLNGIKL